MVKAKKFVLVNYFDGFPKPEDLQLVEEDLPNLENGGIIVYIINLNWFIIKTIAFL